MRTTRRRAAAAASIACSRWRCRGVLVRRRRVGRAAATSSGIPDAQRVGAMDDYERRRPVQGHRAGDVQRDATATTRTTRYKDDWPFSPSCEEDNNVKLRPDQRVRCRDCDAEAQPDDQRRRRPDIIPETYPGQEDAVRRRRRASCRSATTCELHAELPAQGREVGPAGRHRHLRQEDGKYYVLPGLHESPQPQYSHRGPHRTSGRRLGITDDPETWDDFGTDLETVKAAYPDVYPCPTGGHDDRQPARGHAERRRPELRHGRRLGLRQRPGATTRTPRSSSTPAPWTSTRSCSRTSPRWSRTVCSTPRASPRTTTTAKQKFASGQSFAISGNTQEITELPHDVDATPGTTARRCT